MASGFKDNGGKFHPTSGHPKLGSEQIGITNLHSPSKNVISKLKHQNLDSKGRFSHTNTRTGETENIPLESVKTIKKKKNLFVLKGTSPSDQKFVTKIVKLSN